MKEVLSSRTYETKIDQREMDSFAQAIRSPASSLPTFFTRFREGEFELLERLKIPLSSVVHGEQVYERVAEPKSGEHLLFQTMCVGDLEKTGKMGPMRFLVFETTFSNSLGASRGKARSTLIQMLGGTPAGNPAPLESASGEDISIDAMITREWLREYSVAASDPNPIHLEDQAARALGLRSIIAHGMLVAAFGIERANLPEVVRERLKQGQATLRILFRGMTFLGDSLKVESTFDTNHASIKIRAGLPSPVVEIELR
jgi:acyl dehydratase